MWEQVKYLETLKVGDIVRVRFTGHVSTISKVIGKPELLHCLCYHIATRDPNDFGGNWFFSHCFDKWINETCVSKG